MAKKSKLDQNIFEVIKEHADDIESQYSDRNRLFTEMENMYLMDWPTKPNDPEVKITMSPDARNAVLGAVRLMTATDPVWTVPGDKGNKSEEDSKIEQAAASIWDTAGRVQQAPIHYDAVLSSLVYGEVHIPITRTLDLVDFAKQNKMGQDRAERLAADTPFLFEVWNPKDGYPEFDTLGLCSYYRKAKVRAGTLKARFGELVAELLTGKKASDEVELGIFYDLENYGVWIDDKPVIAEEHKLPFIPIAATVTEGSRMFGQMKHTRQPLLYTLQKSGLWERQNLTMTVLYTHLYQMGINPVFLHTAPPGKPEKTMADLDFASGVVDLEPGEGLAPMMTKGIIDPSFSIAMDIAEGKTQSSTIYSQALGEPIGGSPAFSTVALLSQSGRLPLINTQKRGGWAIAEAMRIALNWYKDEGQQCEGIELKPSEVPDHLQLEVKLDVSLPQDKLQMANIANILTQGDDPLVTKEWARENILNEGQSDQMTEEIWAERAATEMYRMFLQGQLAQQQQAMQAAMMQQQQAMMPQQGPPGMPPGMPPEMMQGGGMPPEMAGMGAGPGMAPGQAEMMQGGLPPQMAGMIPGQGQAAMPPEEGMV